MQNRLTESLTVIFQIYKADDDFEKRNFMQSNFLTGVWFWFWICSEGSGDGGDAVGSSHSFDFSEPSSLDTWNYYFCRIFYRDLDLRQNRGVFGCPRS